jgi:gliding motility-associated-like protein
MKQIFILLWVFYLSCQAVFSQHTSRNNYTGSWTTPASWNPTWAVPQTNISIYDITIYGYITVTGSLTFTSTSDLIIHDTLVINGNLSLDNNSDLTIYNNAILIVRGNLTVYKHVEMIANGYIIVTGNIYKGGPNGEGSLTSNDDPVKVFIGGTVPPGLSNDNHHYPALNCTSPPTDPYPNSNCSYGNMTDLINDPIYPFFQHTCTITNVNSNSPVCTGSTINLTSSGGTGYSWSGPDGFTSSAQNPSIPNANTAMTGSYIVTITAAAGCIVTDTTNVLVNALPATPTITTGGPTTFCVGDSVTLTSSAGTNYLWSNGATTPNINVTAAGSYSVQVTNTSGCLSAASVVTIVTVNALPVTPIIEAGGPTAFCAGGSVTLTSSAGTSYLWSNTETTPNINVTTTGSYTVQVTNASGCQSAASVATAVTVNALPVTPTIAADGPTTFCAGGSVTLTSSTGTSYLWSNDGTTLNINTTTAGSYTVQVTNANGCLSAASAATIVNVNALPVINAGTDATIANGTSTTINSTTTGTGPFTYSWSPSAQLVNALIEDPTTVNLPTSTVFTLTATSTTTSCSNTDAVTITISGGPLSSAPTATPGIVCAGANVQLDAIASGGSGDYTYTWTSTPIGFTSSIANPKANPTISTTYNIAVFDGFSTVNSQVIVTVNALPAIPTITADGPTTFCAGGSVTLTSSAATSYLWSTGATAASINVTSSGIYNVQVTNASGCQRAASGAIMVTVNVLPVTPTITPDGPTTFCAGDSVTLTSSAGTSYLWSNAETSSNIVVTTTGSYALRVINASGCQSAASAATAITVNALPATPTITAGGPTTFCAGDSVTLTSSAGTSYLWSNAETSPNIVVTTTGSYALRVTNASGCQSATSTVTAVTVNALPLTPTITAGGPTTFCAGDRVTLTSSTGTSYLWSNAETSPNIVVTSAGIYTVRVTNASGCQSPVSEINVVVNTLPLVNITSSSSSMCINDLRTLTGSPAGGTFIITDGPGNITGNVLSANGPGNINLVYNYTGVCANKATQSIIVNENPVAIAGPDQELKFVFETQMKAELSSYETGEWSLISGSGLMNDINSPTTRVAELSIGENSFLWKVWNGNCEDSTVVKITVYDLFIPSVITPNGDGKNDYFKIKENIGRVELIIFNRWGNEEYTNGNYSNDWEGQNNKGAELSNDTYFYILKFENGKIKKGSVLIKR